MRDSLIRDSLIRESLERLDTHNKRESLSRIRREVV